jgi:hypothetical protein
LMSGRTLRPTISSTTLDYFSLPALLSDPGYRRRVLQDLDDPWGLGPFWAAYERLSGPEKQQTIAPVMRRLRQLLLRPRMRAVLGQTKPRFDLSTIFTERKILLVNLAKGLLGPEASSLMGSLVVSQLWQTALGRAALSPERRTPVFVLIDELQDQVHGVADVGEMLAQARGLGVGLHVAHQHLGQLDSGLRSALAANARSKVIWQCAADDANFFARGQSVLRAEDFQRLPPYEAYASVLADGQVTPFASIRTEPLGPTQGNPESIRASSRQRYGVEPGDVEAALRQVLEPSSSEKSSLGVRRRPS